MLKKLISLTIPALLVSCGPKEYIITGTSAEYQDGAQVVLKDAEGNRVDSCIISEKDYSFAGHIEGQSLYTIQIDDAQHIPVFVQNGATISIDSTSAVSDNGGLNDIYNAFMTQIGESTKAIKEQITNLRNSGHSSREIQDSISISIENLYAIYRKGIDDNKDNYVGAQILGMVCREFYTSLEQLDSVMAVVKFASEIKAVNNQRLFLETAEATKEGKMFTDFSGFGTEGGESKLSDYVGKGKYVLVDFWASWCGPCKMEIPNLIELQNKFGGEKFTVLGVNVWDNEDNFKVALKEEGIKYPQIFVPKDNKDNATELYGIQGIPQIILFGPDGTIIKRNLRGEAMKTFVSEQFK